jgi:hypothetical protein
MASGAEPPHVEEDEDDEGEGGGGGGKAGGPVGDAELLEEAHGAPVVEGGFLEPGFAVENRGDCSCRDAVKGVTYIFGAKAAGDHLGVDGVAGFRVRGKHFAGDLRVSWLVRAYQAKLVAAEDGDQAVEQQEAGYGEEHDELSHGIQAWQFLAKPQDGCVFTLFAGRGRLLTIVHLSMERDKAIRVLSVAE